MAGPKPLVANGGLPVRSKIPIPDRLTATQKRHLLMGANRLAKSNLQVLGASKLNEPTGLRAVRQTEEIEMVPMKRDFSESSPVGTNETVLAMGTEEELQAGSKKESRHPRVCLKGILKCMLSILLGLRFWRYTEQMVEANLDLVVDDKRFYRKSLVRSDYLANLKKGQRIGTDYVKRNARLKQEGKL